MSKAERIMQITVEKTVKKQRKPEEKGICERLLKGAAEEKLVRSSGSSSGMKEGTLEEIIHELQLYQIELEMQNEELRKAQLNLEKSRQRYADLYDFAPVGYFTFTPEALIKEVNLTGATLLEMDRQRLINGRFRRFVAPSDFDQWDQHFLRVLREGEKQTCDLTLKRQEGSTFQAGLESIRMEVSRGEFEVHTTVTDITERKQAEETLQESEERYRDLVENSYDLICTHDLDGNLLSVNEAPVKFLGYSRESLLQTNMIDFLVPELHDQWRAYLKEIQEKGRASGTLRIQTASGETRYWEYNNTLRTEGVAVPIVRGMAHDVTERRQAEKTLRESEERYRVIFEGSTQGILITDFETSRILYANPSICRMLGYSDAELVQLSIADIHPKDSLDQLTSEIKSQIQGEKPISFAIPCLRKNGTVFYADISGANTKINGRECTVGFFWDITERKGAEEKLRESEKRYRDLYDFLPIPVYEMDFEANITSVNRAVYETFRGTEEDLKKGFKAWQLLSPEEIKRSIKNIQRLIKGEQLEGAEYTLRRLDGSVFPAIVISSVVYRNDKPVGLRGVIVDITERKRAEEELKESKALIEAVVENVPLMIFLKEAKDLRFVLFNRAGEELLGYARRDLIGRNNLDLFPPDQAAHFMAKDREVLNGEAGMLDIPEEPILTARKGQRLLHTRKVCIRGSDGVTKFLLGISEDITERKRAEEQLQHTLERLRKAFGSIIQVMVSAVETKDPYTAGHQTRSADLARSIAKEMGLSRDKIDGLRMAGSIHDIGKLSIPAEILSKPTKLSELEFSLIKEHPQKGYEILKNIESPWPLAEIVYQHHERMDGSGYPRGLKGDDILIEARILAVADVVEAMASNRPYRPALGVDAALEEIEKNEGTLYDGEAVNACLRLFREKDYQLEGACF